MGAELLDRFPSIRSFADQHHVGLIGYQSGDPISDYGMVIDRQNSNDFAIVTHIFIVVLFLDCWERW